MIIPAYNQANYLAEAVGSVLDQTYSNLEVIVVNDASTDHIDEVMRTLNDPRITYIVHKENRYAAAARNTGIRASSGGLIAFLDGDDWYQPEKVETLVAFLEQHPDVGLTYNSRIIVDSSGTPFSLEAAPQSVTLSDLVMGYPFAPSDIVMRREWAFRVGLFDESFVFHGEDPDFHIRLSMEGCRMAGVRRVLNFRRRHPSRRFRNLDGVVEGELRAFEAAFSDPRCPFDVLALRNSSLANISMSLSFTAFKQEETNLGLALLRKSAQIDPSIIGVGLHRYRDYAIGASIQDGADHEPVLRRVFAQLPADLSPLSQQCDVAVGRGYLLRAIRAVIWERPEDVHSYCSKARTLGAQLDETLLRSVSHTLLLYQTEFGDAAAEEVLKRLSSHVSKLASPGAARFLKGCYFVNRAFTTYAEEDFRTAHRHVVRAIASHPSLLLNRGVASVTARSTMYSLTGRLRSISSAT